MHSKTMKGFVQRTTLCVALVGGASAFVGAPLARSSPALGIRGVYVLFPVDAARKRVSHRGVAGMTPASRSVSAPCTRAFPQRVLVFVFEMRASLRLCLQSLRFRSAPVMCMFPFNRALPAGSEEDVRADSATLLAARPPTGEEISWPSSAFRLHTKNSRCTRKNSCFSCVERGVLASPKNVCALNLLLGT